MCLPDQEHDSIIAEPQQNSIILLTGLALAPRPLPILSLKTQGFAISTKDLFQKFTWWYQVEPEENPENPFLLEREKGECGELNGSPASLWIPDTLPRISS